MLRRKNNDGFSVCRNQTMIRLKFQKLRLRCAKFGMKRGVKILNNFNEWMLHHLLLFAETELNAVTIKIWSGPRAKAQISGIHASERVWSDNKTKISTMAIYGCNFPIFNKLLGRISRHIRHDSSARRFRSFHRGRVSNTDSRTLLRHPASYLLTIVLWCWYVNNFYIFTSQSMHLWLANEWQSITSPEVSL